MNDNRCVCCGAVIPEGTQICRKCRGTCGTCKWLSDDFTSVCVNGESERRADFVEKNDWCPNWERKGGEV